MVLFRTRGNGRKSHAAGCTGSCPPAGRNHLFLQRGRLPCADYRAQKLYRDVPAAESRANIVEWLHIPEHAKVLELGAGCGTIASALLKKGASVTCQEENPAFARLNALRHQQLEDGRLEVYAMLYEQCEPHLADDYDLAVLVQLPVTHGESQKLLGNLRSHLNTDGILELATENKFGLKYWARNKEPHTHR